MTPAISELDRGLTPARSHSAHMRTANSSFPHSRRRSQRTTKLPPILRRFRRFMCVTFLLAWRRRVYINHNAMVWITTGTFTSPPPYTLPFCPAHDTARRRTTYQDACDTTPTVLQLATR